jgi:hypothetical protein
MSQPTQPHVRHVSWNGSRMQRIPANRTIYLVSPPVVTSISCPLMTSRIRGHTSSRSGFRCVACLVGPQVFVPVCCNACMQ